MVTEVITTQYQGVSGDLFKTHELAVADNLRYYMKDALTVSNFASTFAARLAVDDEARADLFTRISSFTVRTISEVPSLVHLGPEEAVIHNVWAAALSYCNEKWSVGRMDSNAERVSKIVDAFGVEQLLRGIGRHLTETRDSEPAPTEATPYGLPTAEQLANVLNIALGRTHHESYAKEINVFNLADEVIRILSISAA